MKSTSKRNSILYSEVDLEGGLLGRAPVIFCNHFEELKVVLTEVKLVIIDAALTQVNPNTIKICLTFNHLLLGRQLLYYSKTKSTAVRNLTVLSNTTDKINRLSNHLGHRQRREYVVNLRETQGTSKLNINSKKRMPCQFMTKKYPNTFGKLPQ